MGGGALGGWGDHVTLLAGGKTNQKKTEILITAAGQQAINKCAVVILLSSTKSKSK